MKWLTIVISFGVLLAGSGCSSSHQQPGGATRTVAVRLSGEVTHESSRRDRPVQGAIVKLTQSNKVVGETITDAQGKFTVASVPTGPFNVVVEAEEYQRYDYEAEEGELIDALNFDTGRKWLIHPTGGAANGSQGAGDRR